MGRRMTERLSVLALLSLSLALTSTPAKAEMYVAGQIGVNLPQSFSNVQWSAGGSPSAGMTSRCTIL
jgi:hypothetical protein